MDPYRRKKFDAGAGSRANEVLKNVYIYCIGILITDNLQLRLWYLHPNLNSDPDSPKKRYGSAQQHQMYQKTIYALLILKVRDNFFFMRPKKFFAQLKKIISKTFRTKGA